MPTGEQRAASSPTCSTGEISPGQSPEWITEGTSRSQVQEELSTHLHPSNQLPYFMWSLDQEMRRSQVTNARLQAKSARICFVPVFVWGKKNQISQEAQIFWEDPTLCLATLSTTEHRLLLHLTPATLFTLPPLQTKARSQGLFINCSN